MTLGLRPATPAELPRWSAGTASRLGRLRHLAGRVDGDDAQAEGEAVLASNLHDGSLRGGHEVLALLDPVAAQLIGWLWVHTVDDTRGRVAQVQHLWLEGDALPGGVTADDVMDALSLAVAGADVLKVATYTADPVITAVIAARELEPDVLQQRLWLADAPTAALPGPEPVVRLTPMSPESFDRWFAAQEESYADELVQAGLVATEHSRERAATQLGTLPPDGRDTIGNEFWDAWAADVRVGVLWVAVNGARAIVFDVHIHPEHRRRGHARAMMQALHQSLRERGLGSVGLSVFGWNTGARALYASLGYTPVEQLMSRRLTDRP